MLGTLATLGTVAADGPSQLLVMGVHHSATSIAAKALNEMGLYVGKHDDLLLDADNPLKFWERRDVVAANQERHLQAWLSKRLGNPLHAPVLQKAGYHLIGGRLLEDAGEPAAQFMYENQAGQRLTVYLRGYKGRNTAFRFSTRDGLAAFYWIDSPFAYALTAPLPRRELLEIAHLVHNGLAPQ